jgi:hypothetical protein
MVQLTTFKGTFHLFFCEKTQEMIVWSVMSLASFLLSFQPCPFFFFQTFSRTLVCAANHPDGGPSRLRSAIQRVVADERGARLPG